MPLFIKFSYKNFYGDVIHKIFFKKFFVFFVSTIYGSYLDKIYFSSLFRVPFLFVDVGGQRTQRQKWFQV
jgi:hypothetical protein